MATEKIEGQCVYWVLLLRDYKQGSSQPHLNIANDFGGLPLGVRVKLVNLH
jgi:hypothetical protein